MEYFLVMTDKRESRNLTRDDCLSLELRLNVTQYGLPWRHLGDAFYSYARKKPNATYQLNVTTQQYDFCNLLLSKQNWQECKDL